MANDLVVSLLRHGLTLANEQRQYIGWTDVRLSDKGKRELRRKQFGRNGVNIVFSSPLKRCLETAAILFPRAEIVEMAELKEMYFGAWEGKTYEELKNNTIYRKWLTDIFTNPIEAGETYDQFDKRVMRGLQKMFYTIIEEKLTNIGIVTHGGVIRHLMHTYFPHEKDFFAWDIPYGGGYQLVYSLPKKRKDDGQCILLQEAPITVKRIG